MIRVLFFAFWAVITIWAIATRLEARTLVENRFSNVHVIIYSHPVLGTRVQIEADAENGVTPPRRIIIDITGQLTANQLNSATNAYLFVLGQLGAQESVPTSTPTPTSIVRTPTPTPTVTP